MIGNIDDIHSPFIRGSRPKHKRRRIFPLNLKEIAYFFSSQARVIFFFLVILRSIFVFFFFHAENLFSLHEENHFSRIFRLMHTFCVVFIFHLDFPSQKSRSCREKTRIFSKKVFHLLADFPLTQLQCVVDSNCTNFTLLH
jgi:hypothetical protein